MRLLFRLRIDSAGLLEDKKRCRMISDKRCIMCDSRVGEGVAHFLVGCGEFEREGLVLLDDVCRIVGAREWLGEFWRVDEEGEVALLLGKGVEGICNRVMEDVGECVCIGWVDGGREGSNCCMGRLLLDISLPLSRHLSPSLNSWTQRQKGF